jgi:peroxiredoxin
VGLQAARPEIEKLGGEVYALTADALESVARAITEWRLTFIVVADPSRETIRRYGLLNPRDQSIVPATFVIDRQGLVRYRHIGTSAADRPDVREVVDAVRKLAGDTRR